MDKCKFLVLFFSGICLCSMAQKPAGYFGKRNLIGYEYSIRPFGVYDNVERAGGMPGKLKFERIIKNNNALGFNIESSKFLINEPFNSYYLHNKTIAIYIKRFNPDKGIVPIGNYHVWSLENSRSFLSPEKNDKQKATIKSTFLGYDLGRALPLISRRIIFNASVGVRLRLIKNTDSPVGWGAPFDVNQFIYERSSVKIDFGLAYAF